MKKPKTDLRLITEEDLKDIKLDANASKLDELAAVCEVASKIYMLEKLEQEIRNNKNIVNTTKKVDKIRDKTSENKTNTNSKRKLFKYSNVVAGKYSSSSNISILETIMEEDEDSYLDDKKVMLSKDNNKGYLGKRKSGQLIEEAFDSKGKKTMYYSSDDEQEEEEFAYKKIEKKKTKKKKTENNYMENQKVDEEILPMPLELENEIRNMGGNETKLIIQKYLFKSDLDPVQNRFSVPMKQIRKDAGNFLTAEEEKTLNERTAKNRLKPLEVTLIEPNLEKTTVKLRKWDMDTSSSYVLNDPWSAIKERNKLQVNMKMQLWSFRVEEKLHLALVNCSDNGEQDHDSRIDDGVSDN